MGYYNHAQLPAVTWQQGVQISIESGEFLCLDGDSIAIIYFGLSNPNHELLSRLFKFKYNSYIYNVCQQGFGTGPTRWIKFYTTHDADFTQSAEYHDSILTYKEYADSDNMAQKWYIPFVVHIDVEGKNYLHESISEHVHKTKPTSMNGGMTYHIGGAPQLDDASTIEFDSYSYQSIGDLFARVATNYPHIKKIKVCHVLLDELLEYADSISSVSPLTEFEYTNHRKYAIMHEYIKEKLNIDADWEFIFNFFYDNDEKNIFSVSNLSFTLGDKARFKYFYERNPDWFESPGSGPDYGTRPNSLEEYNDVSWMHDINAELKEMKSTSGRVNRDPKYGTNDTTVHNLNTKGRYMKILDGGEPFYHRVWGLYKCGSLLEDGLPYAGISSEGNLKLYTNLEVADMPHMAKKDPTHGSWKPLFFGQIGLAAGPAAVLEVNIGKLGRQCWCDWDGPEKLLYRRHGADILHKGPAGGRGGNYCDKPGIDYSYYCHFQNYEFAEFGQMPTNITIQEHNFFVGGQGVQRPVDKDEFSYIEDLECPDTSAGSAELFATILGVFSKYSKDRKEYKRMLRAFTYIDEYIVNYLSGKYELFIEYVLIPFINKYLKKNDDITFYSQTQARDTNDVYKNAENIRTCLSEILHDELINQSYQLRDEGRFTLLDIAEFLRTYWQYDTNGDVKSRTNRNVIEKITQNLPDIANIMFNPNYDSNLYRNSRTNSRVKDEYKTDLKSYEELLEEKSDARISTDDSIDDAICCLWFDSLDGRGRSTVTSKSSSTEDSEDWTLDVDEMAVDFYNYMEDYADVDALKDILTLWTLVFLHTCITFAEMLNIDPETVQSNAYWAASFDNFMQLFMEGLNKRLSNKSILRIANRMYATCKEGIIYLTDQFMNGVDKSPVLDDDYDDSTIDFRISELQAQEDKINAIQARLSEADDGAPYDFMNSDGSHRIDKDPNDPAKDSNTIPREPRHIHRADLWAYWLAKMTDWSLSGFVYKVLKWFTVTSLQLGYDIIKLIWNISWRALSLITRLIGKAWGWLTTCTNNEKIRIATRVNTNGVGRTLWNGPDGTVESAKLAEMEVDFITFKDNSRLTNNRAICLNQNFVDKLFQYGRLCYNLNGFIIESLSPSL